jgi:5-(carboxyamino)imidazole ribonucleotide synthase
VAGILDTTIVPARTGPRLGDEAQRLAVRIADELGYVGVLAVELFVTGGRLLVNELAPRPHNSGHPTIDACVTDQFEQQVRALCGLPLGEPRAHSAAVMVNLLGDLWVDGEPDWEALLAVPGLELHLYGKRHARPGRKMGHFTVVGDDQDTVLEAASAARAAIGVAGG